MATKKNNEEIVEIKPIKMKKVKLTIVGDTPMIQHCWSEKAKREMLEAQMKIKSSGKAAKNPVEDFINSMYWLEGKPEEYTMEAFDEAIAKGARFGFPVTAFKQAGNSAAYRKGWVPNQAGLRGDYFIEADENGMVEIHCDKPIMREDMVRLNGKTPDLRYRGELRNWRAEITVTYDQNGRFSLQQIVNIINAGGYACGVGEWRPERDGQYGMYHVE